MSAQKLTIEPVTRIEGHARVTIHLNDQGKVEQTFFHVDEFRGLEKFSEGRPYFEMPQITQRICGICPVSHHLAAAKACDRVAGVEPPRPAKLLRELLHMGQIVQSHGMHFFHLAAPDLLFGFDADPAIRNVVGIIQANPTLALQAVNLRRYGQQVIERLGGGKRVHPNLTVPGGVNAPLSPKDREEMLAELPTMIDIVKGAIGISKDYLSKNKDLAASFASFPSNYMGLVDNEGGLQLYDGEIRVRDATGKLLAQFKPIDYREYVAEHVEPWSFLKFPYYRKIGWPQGAYRVGPLGRLNVVDKIGTPLANEEFKVFRTINGGKPVEGSLYYHYARLIETLYGLERIDQLLSDPDILSEDVRTFPPAKLAAHGVGIIEAPRGTLFHEYTTDENGLLTKVNLIVATGNNNWAMHKSAGMVAKEFVDGKKLTEGMLNRVEVAIRCYDPCLSCSTHALGQMPLEVTLVAADGTVLDCLSR
ncbi:MAG: Ni/Fe hydrogenase subunit alpha [Chloroflexi bacterium]|nr:Ni/Fe hydrogenase subunit alpha [Chloroflexota bacterium]